METVVHRRAIAALAALIALAISYPALTAEKTPAFKIDPSFPKELPHQWILGQIGGIFVDAQDHVWINQRPGTLDAREKRAATVQTVKCCVPAPPVIEFDQAGNVIRRGAGPAPAIRGPRTSTASSSMRTTSSGSPATA